MAYVLAIIPRILKLKNLEKSMRIESVREMARDASQRYAERLVGEEHG